MSDRRVGQGQLALQHRPRGRRIETGLFVVIPYRQRETALQGSLVMLKLSDYSRESVTGEGALNLGRGHNGESFGTRVLHGIACK